MVCISWFLGACGVLGFLLSAICSARLLHTSLFSALPFNSISGSACGNRHSEQGCHGAWLGFRCRLDWWGVPVISCDRVLCGCGCGCTLPQVKLL